MQRKNRYYGRLARAGGLLGVLALTTCQSHGPYVDVAIGEATPVKLEAVGAELDPHFFAQNLTRNDGAKPEDWQHVMRRVKAMELQKFRVMHLPQRYETINDNDDPHTTDYSRFAFDPPEMQSLYKVLDLAQEQGLAVCMVVWGCPLGVSLLDPA